MANHHKVLNFEVTCFWNLQCNPFRHSWTRRCAEKRDTNTQTSFVEKNVHLWSKNLENSPSISVSGCAAAHLWQPAGNHRLMFAHYFLYGCQESHNAVISYLQRVDINQRVSFLYAGIFRRNVKLTDNFIYISLPQKLQNLHNVSPRSCSISEHF